MNFGNGCCETNRGRKVSWTTLCSSHFIKNALVSEAKFEKRWCLRQNYVLFTSQNSYFIILLFFLALITTFLDPGCIAK
jgi:cAMP phosphodiesterase